MARVALDAISLAVNEWPGPLASDKSVVCIHGLTANHTCWASTADVLSPDYHYTVLLGQNPEVESALRAFLAAR